MRLPERLRPLGRQPWIVLGPLIAAQLVGVLILALNVQHNGWLYYGGGDESYYLASAWILSDGHLPSGVIGYGAPLLYAPVALFAGANPLAALPILLVLQVCLLLPLTVFLVYGIALRIGGRAVAYFAAALWVLGPFASIPLFVERYQERYTAQVLPQLFGLTALGDFLSMVALLAAAYFTVRALDAPSRDDALLAGVASGYAAGIKPSNMLFLPAAFVALALARRWSQVGYAAAGVIVPLLTVVLWKERGLGHLPVLSLQEARIAAGPAVSSLDVFALDLSRYLRVDWSRLHLNILQLSEYFWSARLLEWAPIAGVVAVARRSGPLAALLALWLAAFLLVKGSSPQSSVESGAFFRLMMAAFPAFVLLVAAIPLLIPTLGTRISERWPAAVGRVPGWRLVGVIIVACAIAPLLVVASFPTATGDSIARVRQGAFFAVTEDLELEAAERTPRGQVLRWRAVPAPATTVFYRVYRYDANDRFRDGLYCEITPDLPTVCELDMVELGTTAATEWVDTEPHGAWEYRVAMAAAWEGNAQDANVLLASNPAYTVVPQN